MIEIKQRRIGPLSIVVALLLFSAALRLTGAAGLTFAAASADTPTSTSLPIDQVEDDEELSALLESFQSRDAAISEKEEILKRRTRELEKIGAEIAAKFEKLKASEQRLRELLAIADVAAEDDVARLTSVYESMKPKAAATVFEQMPPDFAAGFLSRMQPASAALVMASLSPETAYAISVVFAGRNAEKSSN